MKKLQQGFSAIEGLLILVIVAILGGTGYYVWHATSQTNKTLEAASSQKIAAPTKKTAKGVSPSPPSATTETLVKSADNGVQIKLPTGWSVDSRTDGGPACGIIGTPTSTVCITDITFHSASDPTGGYVKIFTSPQDVTSWHKEVIDSCNSPSNKTINGNPELVCQLTKGTDYTVSNGKYIVYFAGDDTSGFTSIVNSVKFL